MAEKKGNTELINIRFYENQKRQALTTSEQEDEDVSSSVATSCEDNPSVSASSLAISAPSDKSRKGSVDYRILKLVNQINEEKDSFFTTSSCSGRIILYTWENEKETLGAEPSKLKRGCKWLLVTHDEVNREELFNAYEKSGEDSTKESSTLSNNDIFFKMEPCIFHVQCRTLSKARKLIHLATESGFRNSGMVIGKDNRITVAIRSAMGLEVPLPYPVASRANTFVTKEYFNYLANIGNSKMRENWTRTEKLASLFSTTSWID